ncbi:MAG: response regulator [Candidatus Cloacimonas sp.]
MEQFRILVVDDSRSVVDDLAKSLNTNGFIADIAFSGTEALHKIESAEYNLVICGIEMPEINGLDFLAKVRNDYDPDLDVILTSNVLDHRYFSEAIRLGVSDYIRKPIETKQLLRSVQAIHKRQMKRKDFSEFYNNLEKAEFNFVLDPRNFSKFAVSELFNNFLQQNFNISHNLLNEILICVDEMVYNAYIHGTLGLSVEERMLDHNELYSIINGRLKQPEIAAKRLRFQFFICHKSNTIKISVEDDGPGFDYEKWLKKVTEEPKLNLEESGRGISMLYHLSDKLEFDKQGRKVSISKKLLNNTQI